MHTLTSGGGVSMIAPSVPYNISKALLHMTVKYPNSLKHLFISGVKYPNSLLHL